MQINSKRETLVTITLAEREAKLLICLVGAISPKDAEETIRRGIKFEEWIGKLGNREVTDFTGNLFEGLFDLFS